MARPFHTRALGTSALVLAFIMLYYGWDQGLRLSRSESRYFLLAIPGLCILVGVGWSGILGTLRARGRSRTVAVVQVASIVAVLVPMVAPWAKAYSWIGKDSTTTRSTYGWHESRRDEIMAMTGWSGPEIAGRVAGPIQRSGVINPRGYLPALDRESRGLGVEYMFAWQYLLHPNGEDFQGSQAPPCALWLRLQSPEDQDRTAEDLVHEFAMRPVADLRILDEATWAEDRFIVYDTSDAFCHCTVSNRYVLTTTEKATLPLYSVVPPGSALKLSEEPGAQRYFAVLQYLHHRVLRGNLIFDFEMNDAEQFVTLHSNQLRGYAQVEGYFNRATLQAPQLIWKNLDTGDEHVTTLWEEFVGWGGIYTPLRIPVTPLIPQGRYTVTLRTGFYGFYFENIEERYPDVKSLLIAPEFYVDENCDSAAPIGEA